MIPPGRTIRHGRERASADLADIGAQDSGLPDFGAILQRMRGAVIVTDPEGRTVWANPAFLHASGYTLEELRGRTPSSVLAGPETDPATVARIRHAFVAREPVRVEVLNYRKNGESFWVDLDVQPLLLADGTLRGFFSVERDISERRATFEKLEREMRLRAGAERAARVGAWWASWTKPGTFEWSPEIFRILGIEQVTTPDRDVERAAFGDAGLQHVAALTRIAARTGEPFETEIPLPGESAPRRWIRVFGAPVMVNGRCTEMFGALQDITQVKALEAEVLTAAGREREHIAVDLHDELGQELTGLRLSLDALRLQAAREAPALLGPIDRALDWALRACGATRTLSHELSATVLQNGLGAALLELVDRLPQGLCELDVDASVEARIPRESFEDLYRIAQEATNNAVRHGHARRISIRLLAVPRELRLTIADDGIGFTPGDERPGLGLTSMRYRAGRIGALLMLQSAPGEGTQVVVAMPSGD